ncbi:cupin domain-containing protein [bacterium]|nr:cupin domain-containing protein [bacterium]
MKSDSNVPRILQMDGVSSSNFDESNQEVTHIPEIIENYGRNSSWSHTVVNSPSNSATLICQLPGEGNRMHHHPEWDEWWYIIEGEWEWMIEGEAKKIKKGDVVFIERNRKHKIKAVGDSVAIRLAVSRYDVDHVYENKDF